MRRQPDPEKPPRLLPASRESVGGPERKELWNLLAVQFCWCFRPLHTLITWKPLRRQRSNARGQRAEGRGQSSPAEPPRTVCPLENTGRRLPRLLMVVSSHWCFCTLATAIYNMFKLLYFNQDVQLPSHHRVVIKKERFEGRGHRNAGMRVAEAGRQPG